MQSNTDEVYDSDQSRHLRRVEWRLAIVLEKYNEKEKNIVFEHWIATQTINESPLSRLSK